MVVCRMLCVVGWIVGCFVGSGYFNILLEFVFEVVLGMVYGFEWVIGWFGCGSVGFDCWVGMRLIGMLVSGICWMEWVW